MLKLGLDQGSSWTGATQWNLHLKTDGQVFQLYQRMVGESSKDGKHIRTCVSTNLLINLG